MPIDRGRTRATNHHDHIKTTGVSLTRPGGGIDPVAVAAVSADVEASYVMEGGNLFPEPGSPEEYDWKTLAT